MRKVKRRTIQSIQWFVLLAFALFFSQFICAYLQPIVMPGDKLVVASVVKPTLLRSILSVSIVPVIEEWLFRGKLLTWLTRLKGKGFAIIVSSLLFALIHFERYFLPFFFGGVIYSVTKLKLTKLRYSILLHGLYNGAVLLLNYWG